MKKKGKKVTPAAAKARKKVSLGDLETPRGAAGVKGGDDDAMKRVLFGAAGVTGGLATPG